MLCLVNNYIKFTCFILMIKVLVISSFIHFTSFKDETEDETAIVVITPTLRPTTDSNSRNPQLSGSCHFHPCGSYEYQSMFGHLNHITQLH